jgi:hypothetical protein
MDIWLALTLGEKLINILIICGALGLVLLFIALFLKFLNVRKLNVKDTSIELNNKEEATPVEEIDDKRYNRRATDRNWNLKDHKLFKLLEMSQNNSLYLDSQVTNKLIVNNTYLQDCVFRSLKDDIYDFVCKVEKNNGEGLDSLNDVLYNSMERYKSLSSRIIIKLVDGSVIMGIPDIYLFKLNKWMDEHITFCLHEIQHTITDSFYAGWQYKISTCLEYLYVMCTLIIEDANRTMKRLNGDLDKEIEAKTIR